MSKHKQHASAKIYQFPTRPRSNSDSWQQAPNSTGKMTAQFPTMEFGRGWYHEAALEEEELARNLPRRQHWLFVCVTPYSVSRLNCLIARRSFGPNLPTSPRAAGYISPAH